MNKKELTQRANEVTRSTLERILLKPEILVAMETQKITPEAIGQMVKDILEYLDKTEVEG